MINLPIPLKHIDQRVIYNECADAFQDKTALGYIEEAVESAGIYEKYIPKDIAHFPEFKIEEGDDTKIIKVYTEKFAREDSVGRKYYEAIRANAKGRCPICGGGKLTNLDHFLPKSLFPLLCVTPANLIPECRDCNFDKKEKFSEDYYSLSFNPYFDVMEDVWLECTVDFKSDETFDIEFKNGFDKAKDPLMWKKYNAHLKYHELNATFSAKAEEDINNCKYQYQQELIACGEESVKKSLIEHKDSCEHSDVNSWSSALYRELVRKVHDYCLWLN